MSFRLYEVLSYKDFTSLTFMAGIQVISQRLKRLKLKGIVHSLPDTKHV